MASMDGQVLHNTTNIAGPSDGNSRGTQTHARTLTTQAQATSPGATLIYSTPSRTVRSNWIHYLRESWRSISRTSKFILGTTLFIGLVQIVITIIILIIGKNEICDKPLDVYLIVFLVRLGFALPLTLHQYLRPSGLYRRSNLSTSSQETVSSSVTDSTEMPSANQNRNNNSSSSINSITLPVHSSPSTNNLEGTEPSLASDISSSSSNQANNTPTSIQQHDSPYQSIIMRSRWLDRFKSLLDLISILWFVVGNYMMFTSSEQCHHDAKYLFYTTLTWILLGYFLVLIPLLLCFAVIFCLPCFLVAIRVFNVDYATGMVGANKNEIQAIPVYKYKSSYTSENHHHPISPTSSLYLQSTSSPSACSSTDKKKRSIMAHFISYHNNMHHSHNMDEESVFEEWALDSTDASCTICLSDYENGDLICKLRCNHHFHKDCVHEWLSLNYKCPLCQRDFRISKINDCNDENQHGND